MAYRLVRLPGASKVFSFNKGGVHRLLDAGLGLSPSRTQWEILWNLSCFQHGAGGVFVVMSEIVSRVFVVGVLLFYAGLVMAFLLWNLGRWLRGSGKRKDRPPILERSSTRRILSRPFGAP